jgi:hypothetical protein
MEQEKNMQIIVEDMDMHIDPISALNKLNFSTLSLYEILDFVYWMKEYGIDTDLLSKYISITPIHTTNN